MGDAVYTLTTGNSWTIPTLAGAYPMFPGGANEATKRRLMAAFIATETGTKQWEATSNLLRNQLL